MNGDLAGRQFAANQKTDGAADMGTEYLADSVVAVRMCHRA
jgi:hypothetical protein